MESTLSGGISWKINRKKNITKITSHRRRNKEGTLLDNEKKIKNTQPIADAFSSSITIMIQRSARTNNKKKSLKLFNRQQMKKISRKRSYTFNIRLKI